MNNVTVPANNDSRMTKFKKTYKADKFFRMSVNMTVTTIILGLWPAVIFAIAAAIVSYKVEFLTSFLACLPHTTESYVHMCTINCIFQAYEIEQVEGEFLEARRKRRIAQALIVIGCFACAGYVLTLAGLAYAFDFYNLIFERVR